MIRDRRTPLLLLLLALAACGEAPGATGDHDGARLFVIANCITCHGRDGAGSQLGPPLRGLDQHWTRETLADYLSDPKAVIDRDPRLQKLAKRFAMMPMPPVLYERELRLRLADHALALSAGAR